MKVKYGIKLWSINSALYPEIVKLFDEGQIDYLELLHVPGKSEGIGILTQNEVPVIVHAPTFNQNIFFGTGSLESNTKILHKTIGFAKMLRTNQIVIHPDIGIKDQFKKFLNVNRNVNLIIENMPKTALNNLDCLGFSVEELKEYLSIGHFKFCLDFGHAIKAAKSLRIDYRTFLMDIIKLKPYIAHICDGNSGMEKDEHLNLGEGNYDLKFIKSLIKENEIEKVTFEVPKKDGLQNDLKNISFFKSLR